MSTNIKVITEKNLRKAFDVDVRIRSFEIDGKMHTCVLPIGILNNDMNLGVLDGQLSEDAVVVESAC